MVAFDLLQEVVDIHVAGEDLQHGGDGVEVVRTLRHGVVRRDEAEGFGRLVTGGFAGVDVGLAIHTHEGQKGEELVAGDDFLDDTSHEVVVAELVGNGFEKRHGWTP